MIGSGLIAAAAAYGRLAPIAVPTCSPARWQPFAWLGPYCTVMRISEPEARAIVALVDPPPPETDVELLSRMLRAHLAAFEGLERVDLEGVEPSACFEARWDG